MTERWSQEMTGLSGAGLLVDNYMQRYFEGNVFYGLKDRYAVGNKCEAGAGAGLGGFAVAGRVYLCEMYRP